MTTMLDSLCRLFDDELERQETILALARAQGAAARVQDIELLEAKTAALVLLMQDAIHAERQRLEFTRDVVDHLGLPEDRQSLTALAEAAPEPWRSRMRDFQARMRKVIMETAQIVRENNTMLRHSLRAVNDALDSVLPGALQERTYGADAHRKAAARAMPSLVNQQG